MFKRKSTNDDTADGEKGKAGSAEDEVQQPKKRALPSQSVTVNFFQRTWEEIPPGKMFYLPTCQSPQYMFDDMMEAQFNKFAKLAATYTISKPKVRISNIIMLQDDLRVQNNTPTDATAFTQVCYLMHFVPQNQKQYFKFQDLAKDYKGQNLQYNLTPNIAETQLVELKNFELFERLGLITASVQADAGVNTGSSDLTFDTQDRIINAYIPIKANSPYNTMGGNLQMIDFGGNSFIPNKAQILLARNMNGLSFHKYGDEINFEIETNLEGEHLMLDNINNFLAYQIIEDETKKKTYLTEWAYPGRNRPYFSRRNNLDPNTFLVTNVKDFKPLTHHFFMMPPILKPNGSLLGQRCSFVLEQSMDITFYFNQSFFPDPAAKIYDEYTNFQDSAIWIRRNIYGHPGIQPLTDSYFCGANARFSCTGIDCPESDTIDGWENWMCDTVDEQDFEEIYTISFIEQPNAIEWPGYWDKSAITANLGRWLDMLSSGQDITFKVQGGKQVSIDGITYWSLGELSGKLNTRYLKVIYQNEGTKNYMYLTFIGSDFADLYRQHGIRCYNYAPTKRMGLKSITKQEADVYNRDVIIFFA